MDDNVRRSNGGKGALLVRLRSLWDRLQSSLFVVPMLFVIGGVVLGELMLVADGRVDGIPTRLTATVDSARSVLSVVAGATLAFAGIAFSVSLLLISLASSQFSPRVVHGLFRDPFNTRVMGFVVGTFTYCLVVLRAVRGPFEEGGAAVIPSISILLAVVLGIAAVLSIVAFIDHAAHSMDVSKILHRVTNDSIERIRADWPETSAPDAAMPTPLGDGFPILFGRQGWIQHIAYTDLLEGLEQGSCMRVETSAGRYAIPGTPLATVWPEPADPELATERALQTILVGETRTTQQDVAFGLRQLVDVALKALSPGINDPTTAQDAMFHLGAVLREMLARSAPPRVVDGPEGRVLLLPEALAHAELIDLAFDEVRIVSATQPTVSIYLLEVLHLLAASLDARDDESGACLRRQADLVLEVSERADLTLFDHERVRSAHRVRFP